MASTDKNAWPEEKFSLKQIQPLLVNVRVSRWHRGTLSERLKMNKLSLLSQSSLCHSLRYVLVTFILCLQNKLTTLKKIARNSWLVTVNYLRDFAPSFLDSFKSLWRISQKWQCFDLIFHPNLCTQHWQQCVLQLAVNGKPGQTTSLTKIGWVNSRKCQTII